MYVKDVMKLSHFFNGVGVELVHMPNATTDGDSIVIFRGADDVISTGDIFDMSSFPSSTWPKAAAFRGNSRR